LSNITDVLNGLSSASLWQERVYKDLHAHPELSFHETRTAALAAAKLKEVGYEVLEQIGHTGVVGVLRNGTGQTVLARADMDALPVKERTGLPYASRPGAFAVLDGGAMSSRITRCSWPICGRTIRQSASG
jgi:metal-dependent amidase/aminoacylase/carboxypeptidase family protein